MRGFHNSSFDPPTLGRSAAKVALANRSPESWIVDQTLRGDQTAKAAVLMTLLPRSGTILVREWQGTSHHVTVVDGGFLWNGKTYRSLSGIARAITGISWNGPRFFGMREGSGKTPERG
jgi:Protein of unknown function (DUF2924)